VGKRLCVALIGRPNVGKSRLFNRLSHSRRSIVHDTPGVTRDILAADLANGATLLDTGGLAASADLPLADLTGGQTAIAIAMADVILFVLDGRSGPLPADLEIAEQLRRTGKRIIPVVNKIDRPEMDGAVNDYFFFGFPDDPLPISAEHCLGIDALEKLLFENMPSGEGGQSPAPPTFAILGAPNTGKSSLANALLRRPRMVVSDLAGTTRDAVWEDFSGPDDCGGVRILRLMDTAGLRIGRKINDPLEYFSTLRTREALADADVALLVLDALRGLTQGDKKIANEVMEAGKCLAVIVNKWDLAERAMRSGDAPGHSSPAEWRSAFSSAIRRDLFAWPNVPVLFTASLSGDGISLIPPLVFRLFKQSSQKVGTGVLNRFLQRYVPAEGTAKRSFKIFYALQIGERPMAFRFYCNHFRLLAASRETQLRHRLMEEFSLDGCPLQLQFLSKERRKPGGCKKNFLPKSLTASEINA
jgi:GTP-binding protein